MDEIAKFAELLKDNPWLAALLLILTFALLIRAFAAFQNSQSKGLATLTEAFNEYRVNRAKEFGQLQAHMRRMDRDISRLQKRISDLEQELARVKLERDSLQQQLKDKQGELDRVLAEMTSKIDEAVKLIQSGYDAEIQRLTEDVDGLKTKLEAKEMELQEKVTELAAAKASLPDEDDS